MADNIEITPGVGTVIATDAVGSGAGARHFQFIKLVDGREPA